MAGSWREKTEARARRAGRRPHAHGRQIFFMPSNYYRMSDVLLTIARRDTKRSERFRKSQESFRAAAKLTDQDRSDYGAMRKRRVRRLLLPSGQSQTGKWPAVLFLGGADAYAEEIYFGGKQMLERGWAMLLVDTPGTRFVDVFERHQDPARLRSPRQSLHRLSSFPTGSRC